MAQSEMDWLQAQRIYLQQLVELSRLTVMDSVADNLVLTDTLFIAAPVAMMDTVNNITDHPLYQTMQAQRTTTAAGLKEIQKAWVPQLDVWGNFYARGSGVEASGQINKSNGFNLSRTNAGLGLQLSFPLLQFSAVNIKKKQYQSLLKADDARLSQTALDIKKQIDVAVQQYRQDIKIAAKSPVLLKSATDVYQGLQLSYASGLIDYTRLAEAQYQLLKAEINDANMRLQLWRSLLAVAVAKGNLNLFTDQLK